MRKEVELFQQKLNKGIISFESVKSDGDVHVEADEDKENEEDT